MKTFTQKDYDLGSTVFYLDRIVSVLEKSEDIKDGRPGFSGERIDEDSGDVWGYDSQIERVVR